MSEVTSPTPRRGARTFRAACGVLAAAAAAQAVAWGVVSRPEPPAAKVEAVKPEAPAPAVPAAPADPFSSLAAQVEDPHPELRGPAGEAPAFDPAEAMLAAKEQAVLSVPPKPPAKIAAPLDVPLKDEAVCMHVDEGLYLRTEGDMKGALEHFRAALQKQPDHPRLLYYTASVLDLMGLPRKADPVWKQLFSMGEGSGDFFKMAQERMADGPVADHEPEEEMEGKFSIVKLEEEKLTETAKGQRVRFVATLKKNTDEAVDVEKDMMLAIHFFDTVKGRARGRHYARSQVPQPELMPLEQPVDWKDGTEKFTFEYWQPDMSPEQYLRFGRCTYYGCTLEVILRDKLQDAAATTPELLQLARELPLPAPESQDNILNSTPDITLPPGRQPEASLFPPALTPPP